MSFLEKAFPFLFEEVPPTPPGGWQKHIAEASPARKQELLNNRATPAGALVHMARDPDKDVRRVLSERLATILPTLSPAEQVEVYDMTISAIKSLAEDEVTAVRVALSSALKDVAGVPHAVARQLADDAERAVAEPILRYSLALSDADLLELIARHPHDWQPVTIASRHNVSAPVGKAVVGTGNIAATRALIQNDTARMDNATREFLRNNPQFKTDMDARQNLMRRLRRGWHHTMDGILTDFLRDKTDLDKSTQDDVMRKVRQHMGAQDNIETKKPSQLSQSDIIDALKFGENNTAILAVAHRARLPESLARRMIDSGTGRAVVALCMRADMPMAFAVMMQQKVARLPPAKIIYPKDGDKCPLSADELQWQYDFFGIKN